MAYSYSDTIGAGVTNVLGVPFGYLKKEHVTVTVDGTPVAVTWPTASSVQLPLSPAAYVGKALRVRRVTPVAEPQVVFQAGGLDDLDLNHANLQHLYLQQEMEDRIEPIEDSLELIEESVETAVTSAATASAAATSASASAVLAELWASAVAPRSFDSTVGFMAAAIPAEIKHVWTFGYYTYDDGGGAHWQRVASQPTYGGRRSVDRFLPDGTTDATNGGWWAYFKRGYMSVTHFGAKIDGTGTAQTAFKEAGEVANMDIVAVPRGNFRFTAEVSFTKPVHFLGVGKGVGPGAASQTNDYVSQILLDYPNPSGFKVYSIYQSIFDGLKFNVAPAHRGGSIGGTGILLSGVGDVNATRCIIRNCGFTNVGLPLECYLASWHTVEDCYFDSWANRAIFSYGSATRESGLGWVSKCYFFGEPNAVDQESCIRVEHGYTVIRDCELLGTQFPIIISANNYPAGFIRVVECTIEEYGYGGVRLVTQNGVDSVLSMGSITNNEFSAMLTAATATLGAVSTAEGGGQIWLDDFHVMHNVTRHNSGPGSAHYRFESGRNVVVAHNILEELGGNNPVGISLKGTVNTGLAAPIKLLENTFRGNFSPRYDVASGKAIIVDSDPLPAATVLAIPAANGSRMFTTNGRATNLGSLNYTLQAGGNGGPCERVNSAWLTYLP